MDRENRYASRYEAMAEEEKTKNYLVVDLDLIIGGKPDLLFELLAYFDFEKNPPSLVLERTINELKHELGIQETENIKA